MSTLNRALEVIAEWLEEYGPAHQPILVRYALLERYLLTRARDMGHDIDLCREAFKSLWTEANEEGVQIARLLQRYLEEGATIAYFRERPELVDLMAYFMALGDIEFFRDIESNILNAATERAMLASCKRLNESYAS